MAGPSPLCELSPLSKSRLLLTEVEIELQKSRESSLKHIQRLMAFGDFDEKAARLHEQMSNLATWLPAASLDK